MSRVIFEDQRPGLVFDTGRADIACFVGLARAATGAAIPPAVMEWLIARGWAEGRYARDLDQLADFPIPVESYAGFMTMFDPGGSRASSGTDYLSATVRSFFAQGGRRCYVVRMGDPLALTDDQTAKKQKLDSLLINVFHDASDPNTWHGIGHLAGLLDVSFLSLPDLPVLTASEPSGAVGQEPNPPSGPEQFVECAQADLTPPPQPEYSRTVPRLSSNDYFLWASNVSGVLQHLASRNQGREPHLREIQFVASFPLPQDLDAAAAGENPSSAELAQDIREMIKTYFPEPLDPAASKFAPNISSAFLQVAYPWLKTTRSNVLLESLEPPEGALLGILARNALTRGTFRSASKITPSEIVDVWPSLPADETKSSSTPLTWGDGSNKPLIERLSVFGFTPTGLRLLSDVTAYPGEAYRAARVNRLVSVICRAARRLGEEIIFDSNGPGVWARVEMSLQQLMTGLWTLSAFDGTTVRDAFSVRCDRSTMTQNDLDNGRLVAQVSFTAAATVEVIRVTLALQAGSTSPQEVAVTLGEAA